MLSWDGLRKCHSVHVWYTNGPQIEPPHGALVVLRLCWPVGLDASDACSLSRLLLGIGDAVHPTRRLQTSTAFVPVFSVVKPKKQCYWRFA